jgi:small subunit ribosomal protein S17
MEAEPQGQPPVEAEARAKRKTIEGVVIGDKMDKTVVVRTERRLRHPVYERVVRRRGKVYAHDENGIAKIGMRVRLVESRPMSRLKRWRVVEVL